MTTIPEYKIIALVIRLVDAFGVDAARILDLAIERHRRAGDDERLAILERMKRRLTRPAHMDVAA